MLLRPMHPKKVLIADDEPALLRLLGRVLERAGFAVAAVASGDEAVARLGSGDPPVDLLLVDAGIRPAGLIPVLEAVTRGITRVMVISGKGLEPDEQAALERIQGRFLPKPFSPEELLNAVQAAFEETA